MILCYRVRPGSLPPGVPQDGDAQGEDTAAAAFGRLLAVEEGAPRLPVRAPLGSAADPMARCAPHGDPLVVR